MTFKKTYKCIFIFDKNKIYFPKDSDEEQKFLGDLKKHIHVYVDVYSIYRNLRIGTINNGFRLIKEFKNKQNDWKEINYINPR